jgi:predicted nucleic acid-binding protein
MVVLLDTGILYAYYDRADRWHPAAVEVVTAHGGGLVVPAPVIPEVDHFLGARLGREARQFFYEGLAGGHFFISDLPAGGYARVATLSRQFAALDLGFVDAAVLAIAESLDVRRIATTDRRDFGAVAAELSLELVP